MPLTHEDLLQPAGPIERQLFPHLDLALSPTPPITLEEYLDGYLDEGYTRANDYTVAAGEHDRYARAWSLYRTYFAVYQRLIATANEARIDGQGSRRYDYRQAQAFLELANQYKDEADGLVPVEEDPAPPAHPPSSSFRHRVEW